MAIIQKIRTRAGLLLAVVIGFALFAFILGDLLTSGGKLMSSNKMNVAEINGKKVSYVEFEHLMGQLEEVIKMQYNTNSLSDDLLETSRTQAWQELLQKYVMTREYNKLGIAVCGDELFDMIQGQNPHPIIMQLFSNPETGAINRVNLRGFLQRMKDETDSEQKRYWLYIEEMIYSQKLSSKYNSLVRKGLYVTSFEAEKRNEETNTSMVFSYIEKPYSSISDSAVKVNGPDLKSYYKLHKENYKQEETRSIKYVPFEIIPAQSDVADAQKWIDEELEDFKTIKKDVEGYLKIRSDEPYNPTNYKNGELPEIYNDFMFSTQEGDIYGPYFEGNAFKVAKLSKINYVSDSVKVSEVLIPVNQNNIRQMQYLADSLTKMASSGYNFEQLVAENSQGPTAKEGGDLGWIKEGTNGRQFSDSCFYAKTGDVKMTGSQAGIHIVKIYAQSKPVKKVQVGILCREVRASEQTDQYYYSLASEFGGLNNTPEKFDAAVIKAGLKAVPVYDLKPLDNNIQDLDKSRQLVRWAFNAAEGDVSKVFRFGDKYVVAIVEKTNHKGYKPLDDLKSSITIEVKKNKKAELLAAGMEKAAKEATSIDAIAEKVNSSVKSVNNIKFTSYSIPELGSEPKVIGAAYGLEIDKISKPIEGVNGVYLVNVDSKEKPENQTISIYMTKMYIERNYGARVNYQTFEILKDLARIKDHRDRFF